MALSSQSQSPPDPDHQSDPSPRFPPQTVSRPDEADEGLDRTLRPAALDATAAAAAAAAAAASASPRIVAAHSRESSLEKLPLPHLASPSIASQRLYPSQPRGGGYVIGAVTERLIDPKSALYGHHRQTSIVHGIQHSRNGSLVSSSSSPLSPQMIAAAGAGLMPDMTQSILRPDTAELRPSTSMSGTTVASITSQPPPSAPPQQPLPAPPTPAPAPAPAPPPQPEGTASAPDNPPQAGTQRKGGKSRRDHSHSHSSRHHKDDQKTVGEYALHVLFASFIAQAEDKLNRCITVPLDPEPQVEHLCGPGVDPAFDQSIAALGRTARQKPKPLIDSIMLWRRTKSDAASDARQNFSQYRTNLAGGLIRRNTEPVQPGQAADGGGGGTSTSSTSSIGGGGQLAAAYPATLAARQEYVLQAERRSTVSIYILCRVLLEVISQTTLAAVTPDLEDKLEAIIVSQLKNVDPDQLVVSPLKLANWNIFAQLLGAMSDINFAGVTDRFITDLDRTLQEVATKGANSSAGRDAEGKMELVLGGMKHLRIKTAPEEAWHQSCDFFVALGRLFQRAHGQRVKSAFCQALDMLLLPIAARAGNPELSAGRWGEVLSVIGSRLGQMFVKPRHWGFAFPLTATMLCVSPPDSFASQWLQLVLPLQAKLKDAKTRSTCLQVVSRLVWTYLARTSDGPGTVIRKLDEVVKLVLPASSSSSSSSSSRRLLSASDGSVAEPLIQTIRMIGYRHPEHCFRTIILPLLNADLFMSNKDLRVEQLDPDRIVVGIRAFLAVLADLECGDEGQPPFPHGSYGPGERAAERGAPPPPSPAGSWSSSSSTLTMATASTSTTITSILPAPIPGSQPPPLPPPSPHPHAQSRPPPLASSKDDSGFSSRPVLPSALSDGVRECYLRFCEILGRITIICDNAFGGQAALDEKFGSPGPKTPMSDTFNFGRRDDHLTAADQKQAFYELLHVAVQALPRCLSVDVPLNSIVNLLCTGTAHVQMAIAQSSIRSLKAIARQSHAQQVTMGFARFIFNFDDRYSTMSDGGMLGPGHIESTLRLYVELLRIWIEEIRQKKSRDARADDGPDDLLSSPAVERRAMKLDLSAIWAEVDQAEAHGLFFLCSQSRRVRYFAIVVLRLITEFDAVLAKSGPKPQDQKDPSSIRLIDILENDSRQVMDLKDEQQLLSVAERSRLARGMQTGSGRGALVDLCTSDVSYDTTLWFKMFPNLIRIAYDKCPFTVTICRDLICNRILQLHKSIVLISEPSRGLYYGGGGGGGSSDGPTSAARLPGRTATATATEGVVEQWKLYLIFACSTLADTGSSSASTSGGGGGGGTMGNGSSIGGTLISGTIASIASSNSSTSSTSSGTSIQGPLPHSIQHQPLPPPPTPPPQQHSRKSSRSNAIDKIVSARTLFKLIIQMISVSSGSVRDAVVSAMGSINVHIYRTLLEELSGQVSRCNDEARARIHQRTNSSPRRNRKIDLIRTEVTHVYRLTSRFLQDRDVYEDEWILDNLVFYTNGLKLFLADGDIQMDWEFQKLRRHYCGLMEELFEGINRNRDPSRWMTFEQRKSAFSLMEDWCGFSPNLDQIRAREVTMRQSLLDQHRDQQQQQRDQRDQQSLIGDRGGGGGGGSSNTTTTVTAAIEIEKRNLRTAALSAMAALCGGPLSVTTESGVTLQFDVRRMLTWIEAIFNSGSDRMNVIGRRALRNLIVHNRDLPYLVDHCVARCYRAAAEAPKVLESYFSVVTQVVLEHPDHPYAFWRLLGVCLYTLGNDRSDIRTRSAHVLRVLEERRQQQQQQQQQEQQQQQQPQQQEDESEGKEEQGLNPQQLRGGGARVQDFDISVSDKTQAVYKLAQFEISKRFARQHSEVAFHLFSELAFFFRGLPPPGQRNIVAVALPWVQSIELRADPNRDPTAPSNVLLANLLEITIKSGGALHNEVQALWQALATGPDPDRNVRLALDFIITLCLDRCEQNFVEYAKQVVVFLASAASAGGCSTPTVQVVIDFLLVRITPKAMAPAERQQQYQQHPQYQQQQQQHQYQSLPPSDAGGALPYCADLTEALPMGTKQAGFSLGQLSLILLVDLMVSPAAPLAAESVPLLLQVVTVLWDHYTPLVQDQAREMLVHLVHELVIARLDDEQTPAGTRASIEDMVELIRRHDRSVVWGYEDSNGGKTADELALSGTVQMADGAEPGSGGNNKVPPGMERLTGRVVRTFETAFPTVREQWARLSLTWATSCTVRHLACRSFQIFRCILTTLDHGMLADMLARLSNTIADEDGEIQTFAMEILTTLRALIRSLGPDRLLGFPQLFWTICACLESINEREFLEAVGMLDEFLTKLDLGQARIRRVLAEGRPGRWDGPFEGVQPLLHKGLRSAACWDRTIAAIGRLARLPGDGGLLVGDDSRLFFAVLANFPRLLEALDQAAEQQQQQHQQHQQQQQQSLLLLPSLSLLSGGGEGGGGAGSAAAAQAATVAAREAAESLAAACEEAQGLGGVAAVLTDYAAGRFRSGRELLPRLLGALRDRFLPQLGFEMVTFLMGLLTNALAWVKIQTMRILRAAVAEVDMRSPDMAGHGSDLISPLLRLLQTEFCMEALEVLDKIASVPGGGGAMDGEHLRMSMMTRSATTSRAVRKEYDRTQSLFGIPEPSGWAIPVPAKKTDSTRANIHAAFYMCQSLPPLDGPTSSALATPEVEFHTDDFPYGGYGYGYGCHQNHHQLHHPHHHHHQHSHHSHHHPSDRTETMMSEDSSNATAATVAAGADDDLGSKLDSLDDFFDNPTEDEDEDRATEDEDDEDEEEDDDGRSSKTVTTELVVTAPEPLFESSDSRLYDEQILPILHQASIAINDASSFQNGFVDRPPPPHAQQPQQPPPPRPGLQMRSLTLPATPVTSGGGGGSGGGGELFSDDEYGNNNSGNDFFSDVEDDRNGGFFFIENSVRQPPPGGSGGGGSGAGSGNSGRVGVRRLTGPGTRGRDGRPPPPRGAPVPNVPAVPAAFMPRGMGPGDVV